MPKPQLKYYQEASIDDWLKVSGTQAKRLPLIKSDSFAADMLKFNSWEQTPSQTKSTDCVLFVVEGDGWLDYDNKTYDLPIGSCTFVEGNIPYNIRASSIGMTLLIVSKMF